MEEIRLEGKISYVQYDKEFVSIEYMHYGKMKAVNGTIKEAAQQKWLDEKIIKKFHYFREGDEVSFVLTRSVRGDKMVADKIRFRFNNSLNNILHKATTDNHFSGYIKLVDDQYFVKEIGSYHFFPLKFSTWEKQPPPDALNEPIFFRLENFANPAKATSVLVKRQFIPEYKLAEKYMMEKRIIDATITKISPHGVYVNIIDSKVQGKLPALTNQAELDEKPGDKLKIRITFLSPLKIVIERA